MNTASGLVRHAKPAHARGPSQHFVGAATDWKRALLVMHTVKAGIL